MWNYFFFISYLKFKEKTEYSGVESYVAQKLEADDISWFPLNKFNNLLVENKNKNNLEPWIYLSFIKKKMKEFDK